MDVPANVPDTGIKEQLKWCEENVIRLHTAAGSFSPKDIRSVKTNTRKLRDQALIHTNASGDFTLMAKKAWQRITGYLELPVFCLHLDGIACQMAKSIGLNQLILEKPMATYHIDHGAGWATLSLRERLKFFATKPWLDNDLFKQISETVSEGETPNIYNDRDWGLGDIDLYEELLN